MIFLIFLDILDHGIPGIFINLNCFTFMTAFFKARMKLINETASITRKTPIILKFPDILFEHLK